MALNSRGRRMSEKIKMVIVQYFPMHLLVEAISSKVKHFYSYMISRQGLYYFIKQWWSEKGLRRTRNNSILLCSFLKINKVYLWNTMPPIMANSNEGQDHKDKYYDTSRKILSQEMTMYNMEAFSILSLRSYDQYHFFLIGQLSKSKD